jgi:hypothetical protein
MGAFMDVPGKGEYMSNKSTKIRKVSDYHNKKLCECFDCFTTTADKDISEINIELKDLSGEAFLPIIMEKGKYLYYCGVRFAKVDSEGIIHVFKDFM